MLAWRESDRKAFLWHSDDAGETWRDLLRQPSNPGSFSHIPVDLALSPLHPQVIFLSDTIGLVRSLDGGHSWKRLINGSYQKGFPPSSSYVMTFDASGALVIAQTWGNQDTQIYRSTDMGESWWRAAETLPRGVNVLRAHPRQSATIYAGLNDFGVYISEHHGARWHPANHGLQTLVAVSDMASSLNAAQQVYVVSQQPAGGLFRSDDGGLTWTTIISNTRLSTIVLSPESPDTGWTGGPDGLFGFRQGVISQYPELPGPVTDIVITPDSRHQYLCGYTKEPPSHAYIGEYISPDEGRGGYWRTHTLPDAAYAWDLAVHPAKPRTLFAIVTLNIRTIALLRSRDGGQTWQEVLHTGFFHNMLELAIDPHPPWRLYVLSIDNPIYVSADEGDSWETIPQPRSDALYHLALDDFGAPIVSAHHGIFRWDKTNGVWENLAFPDDQPWRVLFTHDRPPRLYVGTPRGVWVKEVPRSYLWMPLF